MHSDNVKKKNEMNEMNEIWVMISKDLNVLIAKIVPISDFRGSFWII